jgi:hypothetical protein
MKRFRSLLCLTAALSLLVVLCAGCGEAAAKEKTFSKAGLSITLTEDYSEQEVASMTATYTSLDSVVMTLKEEYSLFEKAGLDPSTFTLKDYAQLVCDNNKLQADIQEKDGLTCFSYTNTANGKDNAYLAVVYQGTDAFWLVQFSCVADNYSKLESTFMNYAKTVAVE